MRHSLESLAAFAQVAAEGSFSAAARKLGLGFALVLLLTLVVAAIGVYALANVGQRFEGLRQMAQFNTDLLKLRQHEQAHLVAPPTRDEPQLRAQEPRRPAPPHPRRGDRRGAGPQLSR